MSPLLLGQALMLATAGVCFGLALWVQQASRPIPLRFSMEPLNNLSWLTRVPLKWDALPASDEAPSVPSTEFKAVKETPRKHASLVKSFPKKKVLGKVRQVDRINWVKSATLVSHENLDADEIEQRKLMLMHRFLTARVLVALNASILGLPSKAVAEGMAGGIERSALAEVQTSGVLPTASSRPVVKRSFAEPAVSTQARVQISSQTMNQVPSQKISPAGSPAGSPASSQLVAQSDLASLPSEDLSRHERHLSQLSLETTQSNLLRLNPSPALTTLEIHDQASQWARHPVQWDLEEDHHSPYLLMEPEVYPQTSLTWTGAQLGDLAFQSAQKDLQQFGTASTLVQPKVIQSHSNTHSPVTIQGIQMASVQPQPKLVQPNVARMNAGLIGVHSPAVTPVGDSNGYSSASVSESSASESSDESSVLSRVTQTAPFVEALDSQMHEVWGVSARMISTEVSQGEFERGLGLAEEESQHWSTLDWYDPAHTGPQSVPLMSFNTLTYLSRVGGVAEQQEDLGFVFGKIARGWEIDTRQKIPSSRQGLVYLYRRDVKDSAGNIIHREGTVVKAADQATELSHERYYVLLNVNPGAFWLGVSSQWGEGRGALAVPVFAKTGSHRDLTQMARSTLEGHVFADHAEDTEESIGAAPLSIEVKGQPAARVDLVSPSGNFTITQVLTFGNYPFYIHLRDPGHPEEVHQYRVLPADMHDLNLYQISQRKIDQWVAEIDEQEHSQGLSGARDLVVVAVPQLVQSFPQAQLNPNLQYWTFSAPTPGSEPLSLLQRLSVYSVFPWVQPDSPYDQAVEGEPLHDRNSRFIGKTFKGLTLPSVVNGDGKVVWSEMTMTELLEDDRSVGSAEPRVVTIVGPY